MAPPGEAVQLTANQQRVLATLQQAAIPLSAYALLARLREQGFNAPTQIYRALERLSQHGLVHRLESLNAYVPCVRRTTGQHGFTAFAICDNCGHVDEFTDQELSRGLGRWMHDNAFSFRNSTIEIRGKCATCRKLGLDTV
jgi:Fur family transcriptional regulator, zinc uptake regulator